MKLGIIGLPNVGKSTLFNALTNAGAQAANFPFCTIDPNVGVVPVPDKRLDKLTEMYHPVKTTPAVVEFVDIAGLVRGASKGEGLGNKFLSHIREVDAVVHVVRCFRNDDIVHVEGNTDPRRDVEIINMELIFSDMELLERKLDRARKRFKGDKSAEAEIRLCESLLAYLSDGKCARSMTLDKTEIELLSDTPLLTMKPVIYAANIGEEDIKHAEDGTLCEVNPDYKALHELAINEGSEIIPVCAEIEAELNELEDDERSMFLEDLGLKESGLNRLITAGYRLLGLISFLTAGTPEVRAWTIKRGTLAPGAAGKIHSDFEKGFIRAEVVAYDDLIRVGTMTVAKEQGLVRSEGKEYVMKDGDIVLFRFNV
ncbi:Ribosome-binding ATPase YchF [bioreactor metagenome]|uniref:Ribosome-binding ATPase YchF n=1 Tax=bioreactor metagenome TaxID=1076179 RepID=A0A644YI92_9ZZZZ|nr:redox-regulated ATPase YchF [Oscillospiraceae bacterium]